MLRFFQQCVGRLVCLLGKMSAVFCVCALKLSFSNAQTTRIHADSKKSGRVNIILFSCIVYGVEPRGFCAIPAGFTQVTRPSRPAAPFDQKAMWPNCVVRVQRILEEARESLESRVVGVRGNLCCV